MTPIGAKIVDPGLVGYFPPDWTVRQLNGDVLSVSFGSVKNTDANATRVIVELSFGTASDATAGTVALSGTQTIGGEAVGAMSIDIIANVILMNLICLCRKLSHFYYCHFRLPLLR